MQHFAAMSQDEVLIIGAGIAGTSLAALLAATHRVVLIEAENRPGYHATGRSAALFSEIYGNSLIRSLTRASRDFLGAPPPGFAAAPLLRRRGSLFIAASAQFDALRAFGALADVAPATRLLDAAAARALCPALRSDYLAAAVLEAESADIDVHALHQGYLRWFRARGGRLLAASPVTEIRHAAGRWHLRAGGVPLEAPIVVNAAGAWADAVAAQAGLEPLGLTPLRRTAARIDAPANTAVDCWPMVIDIGEQFYFKPDAGRLLISPADETPTVAADAQPEEWDLALAVDRVQTATTLTIERLRHRWAGLRTFTADRSPVVGFAPQAPGFFWLAGQGGYGIQTAPALASAAAALLRGEALPEDLERLGVGAAALAPQRPLASQTLMTAR